MFIMVLHDSYAIIWVMALGCVCCRMLDPSAFRGVPHFQFGIVFLRQFSGHDNVDRPFMRVNFQRVSRESEGQ